MDVYIWVDESEFGFASAGEKMGSSAHLGLLSTGLIGHAIHSCSEITIPFV